jgi:hypothetical protein
MVLPGEDEFIPRVRAVRDSSGRIIGFQDPDFGNRFISRHEALERLRYSREAGAILDSFGNEVGPGALAYPQLQRTVAFINRNYTYEGLRVDPRSVRPGPGQELVEQITVIDKNGRLQTFEQSYGTGRRYDSSKYGGRWRQKISDAIGAKPNERLPSSDLQRSVVRRDYFIRGIE